MDNGINAHMHNILKIKKVEKQFIDAEYDCHPE